MSLKLSNNLKCTPYTDTCLLIGGSWTSVMGQNALDNLTVVDFVPGAGSDVYVLLAPAGVSDFAQDQYPVDEYVFKAVAGQVK